MGFSVQSRGRTPVVIIAALALSLAVGWAVFTRTRGTPPATTRVAPQAADARRPRLPVELDPATVERAAPDLPPSLRDTAPDGWIGVDDDGELVVTPGLRWFFDYYLSASGEESPDELRARIIDAIEARLPATGARAAVALLDRYLAYRERVRDLHTSGPPADLERRLDDLHRIRVEMFGPSHAAILFGEEEQIQRADLQRRAVMADTGLTPEEREQRLHQIEQALPAAVRAARADTFAPLHLRRDEEALRAAGGSDADIDTLRAQRFGPEAAARLAALDREHAAWQQRVDDYRRARAVIETDPSLSDTARTAALDALITQRFSQQERLRVEALAPRRGD